MGMIREKDRSEPGLYKLTLPNGDRRYEVVWRENGGQHRRRARTRAEALAIKRQGQVEKRTQPRRGTATVREAYEAWIAGGAPSDRGVPKPRTRDLWERQFRQRILPSLGHERLGRLDAKRIKRARDSWVKDGKGHRSADIALTALRHMLRDQLGEGAPNPAQAVKALQTPSTRTVRVYEWAEVCQLADATVYDRDATLIRVLALTGLRIGEAGALRWQDVRPEGIHVRHSLGKGATLDKPKSKGSARLLPVTDRVRELLDGMERGSGTEFVFPQRNGRPLDLDNWRARVWRPAAIAAGIGDATPHEMRHTFASDAIANGVDVLTLSKWLGHHAPSLTLDRYGHLFAARSTDALRRLSEAHAQYA